MPLGKRSGLPPVRRNLLVPLPLQSFEEVRRPGTGDPVWSPRALGVAGAAGEGYDPADPQLGGQLHGIAERFVVYGGQVLIGMKRVAVAREGADLQSPVLYGLAESVQGPGIPQELLRLAVGVSRVASGPDLDRPAADLLDVVQGCFEWPVRQKHRENPHLHSLVPSLVACHPLGTGSNEPTAMPEHITPSTIASIAQPPG